MLIFEEIGLAELSPNNPLKVLHSKLEVEEVKFGFIGISNWRIDASKMNRTLFMGRTDPDEEDLIFIINEITKTLLGIGINYDKELKFLAKMYLNMKQRLKHNQQDIYGLRDFYSLIKGIRFSMLNEKD